MRLRFSLLIALAGITGAGQKPAPLVVPFEFYNNAIWFPGTVNGRGPLHLLLDTAAGGCVLNSSKIAAVGLPVLREHEQMNAGSGELPTRISSLPAPTISFGGVTLEAAPFAGVPLDKVAHSYGAAMDGIVGYELMAKYVVRIDFDARTLTLFDPATFRYEGNGAVLPLEVRSRVPVVRARFGAAARAFEGEFLLDEPYPGTVLFATPFARRHGLPEAMRKLSPRLYPGGGFGVGGKTETLSGRLEWLEVGPHRFQLPLAAFAEAKAGAFARADIAGILGGELWRRFRVWLDYAHGRLILEPGAHYDDPFEFDASGLRIQGGLEVASVTPDTPGAEAGIREGDRILELAGRPASALTVGEVRRLLRRAGERYAVKLGRGSGVFEVTLATRRLL
jgi:hypothetical protein